MNSQRNPETLWEVTWLSLVDHTVWKLEVQALTMELAKTFTMRTLWQTQGIPQDKLSFVEAKEL